MLLDLSTWMHLIVCTQSYKLQFAINSEFASCVCHLGNFKLHSKLWILFLKIVAFHLTVNASIVVSQIECPFFDFHIPLTLGFSFILQPLHWMRLWFFCLKCSSIWTYIMISWDLNYAIMEPIVSGLKAMATIFINLKLVEHHSVAAVALSVIVFRVYWIHKKNYENNMNHFSIRIEIPITSM